MCPLSRRRRIADTAEIFNDLAALAGLSPNLFFEDITLAFSTGVLAPTLMRSFHAVVIVVSGQDGQEDKVATEVYTGLVDDVLWFPQTVKHIPDIYALLHAVLNCRAPNSLEPSSIFSRLSDCSYHTTEEHRISVVQEAADLQKAFVTAVANSVWNFPAKKPADTTTTTADSPTVPDRYYVFTLSENKSGIFCISNGPAQKVDSVRGKNTTVLTAAVVSRICAILANKGRNSEAAVVGLVSRDA